MRRHPERETRKGERKESIGSKAKGGLAIGVAFYIDPVIISVSVDQTFRRFSPISDEEAKKLSKKCSTNHKKLYLCIPFEKEGISLNDWCGSSAG